MQAAVVEKPGILTVREVPEPEPGEYQALCALLYGSTCAGTDLHLIDGSFPWPQPYPGILGHESIGRVVKLGPRVRHLKPGDLVTRVGAPASAGLNVFWGGMAEWGIATDWQAMQQDGLPSDRWHGTRVQRVLPPETDPIAATMIITWRETFSYITRAGVKAGDRVLVVGSGANALSFAAHAVNLGAALVAVVGSAARADAAQAVGAGVYVDYRSADPGQALSAAVPSGFDVALDAVGRQSATDLAFAHLRDGGVYGLYGIDDLNAIQLKPGGIWKPFRYQPMTYDEAEAHEAVMEFISQGRLRAADFLDMRQIFSLEHIAEAYEHVRRRRAIKAVVRLNHDA